MLLKSIDDPGNLLLVASWLTLPENCRWLGLGNGSLPLTSEWLRLLSERKEDVFRVFGIDPGHDPIGVVALGEVDRNFRTARIWVATGDKAFRSQGYATRACHKLLTYGFDELGLRAIRAWIVDGNPAVKIAQRLNFKFIGRQRQCHYIEGRPHDRLWFDLLVSEHLRDPAWDRLNSGTATEIQIRDSNRNTHSLG